MGPHERSSDPPVRDGQPPPLHQLRKLDGLRVGTVIPAVVHLRHHTKHRKAQLVQAPHESGLTVFEAPIIRPEAVPDRVDLLLTGFPRRSVTIWCILPITASPASPVSNPCES